MTILDCLLLVLALLTWTTIHDWHCRGRHCLTRMKRRHAWGDTTIPHGTGVDWRNLPEAQQHYPSTTSLVPFGGLDCSATTRTFLTFRLYNLIPFFWRCLVSAAPRGVTTSLHLRCELTAISVSVCYSLLRYAPIGNVYYFPMSLVAPLATCLDRDSREEKEERASERGKLLRSRLVFTYNLVCTHPTGNGYRFHRTPGERGRLVGYAPRKMYVL